MDWFQPAFTEGLNVSQSLDRVIQDLSARRDFAEGLKARLADPTKPSTDRLTNLKSRLDELERTLKFRLGMLVPDRPGAWFRETLKSQVGPFHTRILSQPIFHAFDLADSKKVELAIQHSWQRRCAPDLPRSKLAGEASKTIQKADGVSIWEMVLGLNIELETVNGHTGEFQLQTLPEVLPEVLESAALRTYLLRARGFYLELRSQLDKLYDDLLAASRRFFKRNMDQIAGDGIGYCPPPPRPKRKLVTAAKTSRDLQALRFMELPDFPSRDDLRLRYRAMAKDLHPDRNGGDEGAFKDLTKAYTHLMGRLRDLKTPTH